MQAMNTANTTSRHAPIHPLWMRATHWLNALAVLVLVTSGWRIYNAAPFFPSLVSPAATVGDVEPLARIAYQAILFLGDQALRGQGSALGDQLGGAADSLFGALGWQGGDRGTLAQGLYEVMTTDLRSRLPDVTAPVTVVYGWSPDDASPRAQVESLFRASYRNLRRPPRFEPIQGAEHMVMIDQPTRFNAALDRFLTP